MYSIWQQRKACSAPMKVGKATAFICGTAVETQWYQASMPSIHTISCANFYPPRRLFIQTTRYPQCLKITKNVSFVTLQRSHFHPILLGQFCSFPMFTPFCWVNFCTVPMFNPFCWVNFCTFPIVTPILLGQLYGRSYFYPILSGQFWCSSSIYPILLGQFR